jgi:hypothetical protein
MSLSFQLTFVDLRASRTAKAALHANKTLGGTNSSVRKGGPREDLTFGLAIGLAIVVRHPRRHAVRAPPALLSALPALVAAVGSAVVALGAAVVAFVAIGAAIVALP